MNTTTQPIYRQQFEQLAAEAEQHLQAVEQVCAQAVALRQQMLEDYQVDPSHEAMIDAYDDICGFGLLSDAMAAVGK